MKVPAELRRSGPDVLKALVIGALVGLIAWKLFGLDLVFGTCAAYAIIGAIGVVHAPEDMPGEIDNVDRTLSNPLVVSGCVVSFSFVLFLGRILLNGA